MQFETGGTSTSARLQRRCGRLPNSSERSSGNFLITSPPRTWTRQVSPAAVAFQDGVNCSPSVRTSNSSPRKAANAPLCAFSSAYHGSGRSRTISCHRVCRGLSVCGAKGTFSFPRVKAFTSCFAQIRENDVSVAPSATAKRGCRLREASSYSAVLLPCFGSQNSCAWTSTHDPPFIAGRLGGFRCRAP